MCSPCDTLSGLGVEPRAKFLEENQNLLTALRKDGDTSYLLVYNYQFSDVNKQSVYYEDHEVAGCAAEISFDGIVKPYVADAWSGRTAEAEAFRYEDGRTILPVELEPGDILLFVLDGSIAQEDAVDVDNTKQSVDELSVDSWSLTVESWTPGEAEYRSEYVYQDADGGIVRLTEETEDAALSYLYTTTEMHYATDREAIEAGELEVLVPWNEIEAVGDRVSGIGTYTAAFELAQIEEDAEYRFDVDSFCGGTARVLVNGQNVYVNMNTGEADITGAVQEGENTIEVRVTTTLTNALIESGWFGSMEVEPLYYGMTGEARIITLK